MAANNKPATPLPWIVNKKDEICSAKDFYDVAKFVRYAGAQDAAYAAHACNAYPRLVAALRDAMSYADYCANNGGQQADRDHARFSALLADIGEDA